MSGRATIAMLSLVAACSGAAKQAAPTVLPPAPVEEHDTRADLIRDLEATALENYSHLSLGNYDAYLDSISPSADLALLGLGAGDVAFGRGVGPKWVKRRPFYGRSGVRLVSKNLVVELSTDQQVGWIFDEVSYRVPHDIRLSDGVVIQRDASIPIRVTAAFVRDVDRWVLVMEELSYALSPAEVLDLARGRVLRTPSKLPPEGQIEERAADAIAAVVQRFHERGTNRLGALADDPRTLVVWPEPDGEYSGDELQKLPRLASLFGTGRVSIASTRVSEPIGKVAWMVANLRVIVGDGADRVVIPMRGLYLLEASGDDQHPTWKILQAHVSVPLSQQLLERRIFGEPTPDTGER